MPGRAAAIALLAIASATAYSAASRIPADFQHTFIATEVSFWQRDNYTPTPQTRQATSAAAVALALRHPANPNHQALAARAHAWQAFFSFDPAQEKTQRAHAIAHQQTATRQRPAHAASWRELRRLARADTAEALAADAGHTLATLRMTPVNPAPAVVRPVGIQ